MKNQIEGKLANPSEAGELYLTCFSVYITLISGLGRA